MNWTFISQMWFLEFAAVHCFICSLHFFFSVWVCCGYQVLKAVTWKTNRQLTRKNSSIKWGVLGQSLPNWFYWSSCFVPEYFISWVSKTVLLSFPCAWCPDCLMFRYQTSLISHLQVNVCDEVLNAASFKYKYFILTTILKVFLPEPHQGALIVICFRFRSGSSCA